MGGINYQPCPKCGQLPTDEGHDACLGELPGVKFACCGHGVAIGYIIFGNGTKVTLGKHPIITKEGIYRHD